MADLDALRELMVREHITRRGVRDTRVLEAMARVPRHCFVPRELEAQAYDDCPLPIGKDQTISQPYMVACMTELLHVAPADRVLEIGTGSGYQTAVLAILGASIVTVERHPELHARARATLQMLGYTNITYICGDGSVGWAGGAPYDAILVTAGSPQVPPDLLRQLSDGGRLVCPVGGRRHQQLELVIKQGSAFNTTLHTDCVFVPLTGKEGWPEEAE